LVILVCQAVAELFGAETDWADIKKMLSNTSFMDKMRCYDKDNIEDSVLIRLQWYMQHADFNPDKVKCQSAAAYGLCMWCMAMYKYALAAIAFRQR